MKDLNQKLTDLKVLLSIASDEALIARVAPDQRAFILKSCRTHLLSATKTLLDIERALLPSKLEVVK